MRDHSMFWVFFIFAQAIQAISGFSQVLPHHWTSSPAGCHSFVGTKFLPQRGNKLCARGDIDDFDEWEKMLNSGEEPQVIIRGSDSDDLSPDEWDSIEEGRPSEWTVLQSLLGVNIFTYILAGLILFFGGMNVFLGPGWLGQAVVGGGNVQDVTDAVPRVLDLSNPEYRL